MAYILTVKEQTADSVTFTLSNSDGISTAYRYRIKIFSDSAATQTVSTSTWQQPDSGATEMDFPFSSLATGAYYAIAYSDAPATLTSALEFVLVDNTPKTATQAQWEDLANRVHQKVNIGDVLSEPSSVEFVDTANLVDYSVTVDKIANGAVTVSKIDFTTMKRWVPDYENRDSTNLLANSFSATLSGDGFVFVFWEGFNNSNNPTAGARINGCRVAYALGENTNLSGTRTAAFSAFVPVMDGDTLEIFLSTGTETNRKEAYFVPGMWA